MNMNISEHFISLYLELVIIKQINFFKIMKPLISRLLKNSFMQSIYICQLLSISQSSWAQDQVDLLTQEPVLVYQISHEIIADNDTLKIEIYNDGYVYMHYPSYMKKAGDYTTQLSQTELQHLIQTLNTPNIQNFNNRALALLKQSNELSNNNVTYVSDSSFSSFKVTRRDENRGSTIKQIIEYPHLQLDAKNFPNIGDINKLAEVESIVSNLVNQSNVQELVNE